MQPVSVLQLLPGIGFALCDGLLRRMARNDSGPFLPALAIVTHAWLANAYIHFSIRRASYIPTPDTFDSITRISFVCFSPAPKIIERASGQMKRPGGRAGTNKERVYRVGTLLLLLLLLPLLLLF